MNHDSKFQCRPTKENILRRECNSHFNCFSLCAPQEHVSSRATLMSQIIR